MLRKSTFYTKNLGCRVNRAELTEIEEELEKRGFVEWSEEMERDPDVVILNTCAVTVKAAKETRQTVRQLRRRFPDSFLVAIGCGVTRPSVILIPSEVEGEESRRKSRKPKGISFDFAQDQAGFVASLFRTKSPVGTSFLYGMTGVKRSQDDVDLVVGNEDKGRVVGMVVEGMLGDQAIRRSGNETSSKPGLKEIPQARLDRSRSERETLYHVGCRVRPADRRQGESFLKQDF